MLHFTLYNQSKLTKALKSLLTKVSKQNWSGLWAEKIYLQILKTKFEQKYYPSPFLPWFLTDILSFWPPYRVQPQSSPSFSSSSCGMAIVTASVYVSVDCGLYFAQVFCQEFLKINDLKLGWFWNMICLFSQIDKQALLIVVVISKICWGGPKWILTIQPPRLWYLTDSSDKNFTGLLW